MALHLGDAGAKRRLARAVELEQVWKGGGEAGLNKAHASERLTEGSEGGCLTVPPPLVQAAGASAAAAAPGESSSEGAIASFATLIAGPLSAVSAEERAQARGCSGMQCSSECSDSPFSLCCSCPLLSSPVSAARHAHHSVPPRRVFAHVAPPARPVSLQHRVGIAGVAARRAGGPCRGWWCCQWRPAAGPGERGGAGRPQPPLRRPGLRPPHVRPPRARGRARLRVPLGAAPRHVGSGARLWGRLHAHRAAADVRAGRGFQGMALLCACNRS